MAKETTPKAGFVLLVEDDPETRELEAQHLEPLGLEIRHCASGLEAIEILKTASPELVLLDYSLPDLTAVQLLDELKRKEINIPPFIVATGLGDEAVAVEAMKHGALDYISKNTDFFDNLLPAARKALEKAALLAELTAQRRLLTDILNNSDSAIYAFDLEGRFIIANTTAGKILNSAPENLIGKTRGDFMSREAAETHRLNDLKVAESGTPLFFSEETHQPEGPRYYYSSKFPLKDKAGKIYAVCGIATDITERKQAEEHALRNEKRLEGLSRINAYQPKNTQGLLDYALSEAIALTNSRLGYIYHYSEEKKEFTLNTWSKEVMRECSVVNPETRYSLDKTGIWGEAVRQRRPIVVNDFTAPNPLMKGWPQGHAALVNFMSIPISAGDRIVAVVGVANKPEPYSDSDIRQLTLLMDSVWKIVGRREAQEKTAESEERFKVLVDSCPDGIVVNRGREILFINRTGISLLKGLSEDDFLRTDFTAGVSENDLPRIMERLRLAETKGEASPPLEIRYKTRDGSLADLEVTGAPITFGEENCGVIFFRDIAERKKSERLIRDLANMQRVESLGALAGGIAHDFNNMLTGIMANLSLLSARTGADKANEAIVGEALQAAKNAQSLTSQLLSFSKGGMPVKKEFCLERSLREIFNLSTSGTKAACELNVAESLWSLEGDENQLKQAVNNLLLNALQAMPSGGTLRLEAVNLKLDKFSGSLPPGDYAKITVSDSGIGIPKAYLPRIFDPYFTTKAKGHGLGLSMTYSVVKNHGGEISVSSEPGRGTAFELLLPATGRCLSVNPSGSREVVKGAGRVLALEDEELLIRVLRRMLTELGYDLTMTTDGRDTVRVYTEEQAAGRPFAAVIMDLTIPGGMGGIEAVEKLRAIDPAVPIIVSSGYSDEAVMANYKDYGFTAVLPKPYRYEDLADTLARLLKK